MRLSWLVVPPLNNTSCARIPELIRQRPSGPDPVFHHRHLQSTQQQSACLLKKYNQLQYNHIQFFLFALLQDHPLRYNYDDRRISYNLSTMSDTINNGVVPSIEKDTTTSGTSSLENAKSTVINSEVRHSICQKHIHSRSLIRWNSYQASECTCKTTDKLL